MSEYWKSTPKFWCKHCKTFVRDTKLEKTNHEATAKHQGNIKRFLRDLHRGHERDEREKDKAKSEVERLNGVVSGTPSATKPGPPWNRQTASSLTSGAREATPAERKAQLTRLAEMGIAVPEDFRREMAMAGDWQTISQRRIEDRVKKEEGLEDFKDFKPDLTLNVGVRKRKFEGQEEEEEAGATVVRKGWGSTTRRYPGSDDGIQEDLDSLLNNAAVMNSDQNQGDSAEPSLKPGAGTIPSQNSRSPAVPEPSIKKEESDSLDMENPPQQEACSDIPVKEEDSIQEPAVTFKKRRSKPSGKT
ncbi:MAG: hypothetical protein LQ337_005385 [Flavoplaca oasis]|nr:MAG: hypothetical protein LQ337_005385 [Flavoplaca oasis]